MDRQSLQRIADATRKTESDPIRPRMYPQTSTSKTPVLVRITAATATAGAYTVDVVRVHNTSAADYAPAKEISVVTNQYISAVYDINGAEGIPPGAITLAYPVFASTTSDVESHTGDVVWIINYGQYGLESGGEAWVEITGGTGPYSWKQLDPDATTTTSPSVTGSSNLYEVSGRSGIPIGSTMRAWWDGTNYRCGYHGADSGTATDLKRTQANGGTADSDEWDREAQGTDRGFETNLITGLFADATADKLYSVYRKLTVDANGHVTLHGAENFEIVGCFDDITCGGSGTPPATTDIHWPYEEGSGTTVADIGGSGHDGTGTSLSWATGQIGSYCGDFDGSSSYVSVPNTGDLNPGSGDFSVALWANFDGDGFAYLISRSGGNTSSHVSWNIQYSDSSTTIIGQIQVGGSDYRAEYSTSTPSSLGWVHIAMVRDGGTLRLYIDGTQEDTTAVSGSVNSNAVPLVMGGTYRIHTASFEASFNGKLDDVRYYSRALSASEVSTLATP